MEDYLCWYAHEELFVPNKRMVERVVGSTFSASNVHEIVNDNSNPYRKALKPKTSYGKPSISVKFQQFHYICARLCSISISLLIWYQAKIIPSTSSIFFRFLNNHQLLSIGKTFTNSRKLSTCNFEFKIKELSQIKSLSC